MTAKDTQPAEPKNEEALYVYQVTHRIVYNTKNPVPIKEVIIALQGLEGLLRPVPAILSTLTGVEIAGGEFLIQSLETGSLIEDVIVKFFFKDKEKLDAFVERLGESKIMKGAVIAAVLAALAGYGLHWAAGLKPTPTIQATNSVIIQNGAGVLNIEPAAFKAALDAAAVGNKKGLAESALKLTAPVRSDPDSSITFGTDAAQQTIQYAAIVEAPAKIELEANERIEEYKNTRLVIRATNLDSKKNGWAGKLAQREERLPIELDPSVSEAEIFGRQEIWVDAALVFKEKGRSRELKPARIYVRRVIGPVMPKK